MVEARPANPRALNPGQPIDLWPSLAALGLFVLVVAGVSMLRYRTTLD